MSKGAKIFTAFSLAVNLVVNFCYYSNLSDLKERLRNSQMQVQELLLNKNCK